mmetsp:Transcript_4132/g.11760  ORF Transcript_4132/g.11760 Transcript_4132/m.11760 type:complete len:224 (+) Transcript_4132:1460-2131(+)
MGVSPGGDSNAIGSGAKAPAKCSGPRPSQSPAARAAAKIEAPKMRSSVGASGSSPMVKSLATTAMWPGGTRRAAQTDLATPETPPSTWSTQASPRASARVNASPPSSHAVRPLTRPTETSPGVGTKPYSSANAPMSSTAQRAVAHRSSANCIMLTVSKRPTGASRVSATSGNLLSSMAAQDDSPRPSPCSFMSGCVASWYPKVRLTSGRCPTGLEREAPRTGW